MNLNGKVTNPGELRTQITLLSRVVTTGTGGFQVPTWTTIAVVWARWVNVHGQEAWLAQTNQAGQAATVLIRYRSGVDPTIAITKGSYTVTAAPASTFTNGLYEVVSVDNIQERSEYIELKVMRKRES